MALLRLHSSTRSFHLIVKVLLETLAILVFGILLLLELVELGFL